MPTLQTSIQPLLDIKKDLLKVPQLAGNLSALQDCSATCSALQPLLGIKDMLLQVGSEEWAGGGASGGRGVWPCGVWRVVV